MLQLPMGTFCTTPFRCPHLARCSGEAPALPLRELPELTRTQELELHKEGIETITALDPQRPGLTFRQRRTIACVQAGEPVLEPFVREELQQSTKPAHFLAIAALTDALPRFEGQRPWRLLPYAWATNTLHPDGRLETADFVHVERTDPRTAFITSLAKHLEVGGHGLLLERRGPRGSSHAAGRPARRQGRRARSDQPTTRRHDAAVRFRRVPSAAARPL
jgi:hypothetical protein